MDIKAVFVASLFLLICLELKGQNHTQIRLLSSNFGPKMYTYHNNETRVLSDTIDSLQLVPENVEGFSMNLFALQTVSLKPNANCYFSGEIYLDPRQKYKSNPDENEYLSEYRLDLSKENIYYIPGYEKRTTFIKRGKIDAFYVALKTGRETSQFSLDQIIENQNVITGQEVGCDGCNFRKDIYINEDQCVVSAFFEIKPIYKGQKIIKEVKIEQIQNMALAEYHFEKVTLPEIETPVSKADNIPVTEKQVSNHIEKAPNSIDKSESSLEVLSENLPISSNDEKKEKDDSQNLDVLEETLNKNETNPDTVAILDLTPPKQKNKNSISYHISLKLSENADENFQDLQAFGKILTDQKSNEGYTRYLLGEFSTLEEARLVIEEVKFLGYRKASLVAYKKGQFLKYIQR